MSQISSSTKKVSVCSNLQRATLGSRVVRAIVQTGSNGVRGRNHATELPHSSIRAFDCETGERPETTSVASEKSGNVYLSGHLRDDLGYLRTLCRGGIDE